MEPIMESWSMFVENGAGHEDRLSEVIEARLVDSDLPGAGIQRCRESIEIHFAGHPDCRHRIEVRGYGAHLEIEYRLALTPSPARQAFAWLLSADRYAWSGSQAAKRARSHGATVSVIRHLVVQAARELADQIGRGGSSRVDLDDVLRSW
jgi:hypothetical protein